MSVIEQDGTVSRMPWEVYIEQLKTELVSTRIRRQRAMKLLIDAVELTEKAERALVVARNALSVIAEHGGTIVSHEEHDGFPPTECDGAWCAEQARAALELVEVKGGAQ